jgi:hypothetical protein
LASHATHTKHSTAATTAQTAATQTATPQTATAKTATAATAKTAPAKTATATTASKASELSGYSLGNNARRKNDPELPPGFVCDGYGHPAVASSFGLDRYKAVAHRCEEARFRNVLFRAGLALVDLELSHDRLRRS